MAHVAVIGFDMGGTSTDVSRYDGEYDHVFESVIAGVHIQAPQVRHIPLCGYICIVGASPTLLN